MHNKSHKAASASSGMYTVGSVIYSQRERVLHTLRGKTEVAPWLIHWAVVQSLWLQIPAPPVPTVKQVPQLLICILLWIKASAKWGQSILHCKTHVFAVIYWLIPPTIAHFIRLQPPTYVTLERNSYWLDPNGRHLQFASPTLSFPLIDREHHRTTTKQMLFGW